MPKKAKVSAGTNKPDPRDPWEIYHDTTRWKDRAGHLLVALQQISQTGDKKSKQIAKEAINNFRDGN